MVWNVFSLGITFILLALVAWLWLQSQQMQHRSGLPSGRVIYTDTGTWFPNQEPLYADDVRLVGKPDYLVEQADGMIIPVEVKSSDAPDEPWDGHVYQLAAYCFLVESHYGVRPDFGIIQYRDRAFAVDYTEDLEENFLDLLVEMREDVRYGDVNRDHRDWRVCAGCGVRQFCDQRLH